MEKKPKTKTCSHCKTRKTLKKFHKNKTSKDGYHHYCKTCKNDTRKLKYSSDESYRLKLSLKTKQNTYNLTDAEIKYLFDSYTSCCICFDPFKSKRNTFIDHDHNTGKIRGLLCPSCNTALGLFKDNVSILKSAIIYLTSSQ